MWGWVSRLDADACVDHVQPRVRTLAVEGDLDAPARRRELDGVAEEVPGDLPQAHRIGLDDQRLGR